MQPAAEDDPIAQRAKARLGTWVNGKYRLDRILGIGGMATVFAATHRNQAELAVKMLHQELSSRDDVRTRFLREGYVANSVKHPGAVLVVDDDTAEDGGAFLVMEMLHGHSVEQLWETRGPRLPVQVVTWIGNELLDVLVAAHGKSIVHRDIKPANVFVTNDGALKVLDFGIAQLKNLAMSRGGMATQNGMLLGTPAFMAPEQAMAKAMEIDAQTDLWSVGATLFTLLTGRLVHDAENAAQLLIVAATQHARPMSMIAPDIPAPIAAVIDRALVYDKQARWPNARAMKDALREASMAVFREPPSRNALLAMLGGAEQHPAMAATALAMPAVSLPSVTAPHVPQLAVTNKPMPMTTGIPVMSEPAVVLPTRSLAPVFVAIAALVIGLASVGGFMLLRGRGHAESAADAGNSLAATSDSAPVIPSAAPGAALAPAASSTPSPPPPPPPRPPPPIVPTAPRPTTTTPSPPPPPAPPKPNCAVPYTLDGNGNKKWKPECL